MAGIVVLLSVSLGVLVSPYWLMLTVFAGLNLLQSAFTNWCPAVWMLSTLGLKPCVAGNPTEIVSSGMSRTGR